MPDYPHYHSILDEGYPCHNCDYGLIPATIPCPTCTDTTILIDDDGEEKECPTCKGWGEIDDYAYCPICNGTRITNQPYIPTSQAQLQLQLKIT